MLQAPARDQRVSLDQRLDDRLVGITLLALFGDDALAGEAGGLVGVNAVIVDGEGDLGLNAARARSSCCTSARVQISKSSRPWLGAVCTKPVPASSVT